MPSPTKPSALATLVGDLETFFAQTFGRRAQLYAAKRPADDDAPRSTSHATADLFTGHWWHDASSFGTVDAAFVDAAGLQTQVRLDDASEVERILAAGGSLCADVSSLRVVADHLQALFEDFVPAFEPAFAKLYVSPEGSGFAPHFDAHHVFVLQLEGRKRWGFARDAPPFSPLEGGCLDEAGCVVRTEVMPGAKRVEPWLDAHGTAIDLPPASRWETRYLEPGQVLYLPPGVWHRTEAASSRSVSLSLSPPRSPTWRFLAAALEHAASRDPLLTKDLFPARDPSYARLETELVAALDRVRELVGGLDVRGLRRRVLLETFATAPAALTIPEPATGSTSLSPETRLIHASSQGVPFVVAPLEGVEHVCLYTRGAELLLPATAQGFAEALATHPRFTAAEALTWDPRLAWADAAELLSELIDAGLLARDDAADERSS